MNDQSGFTTVDVPPIEPKDVRRLFLKKTVIKNEGVQWEGSFDGKEYFSIDAKDMSTQNKLVTWYIAHGTKPLIFKNNVEFRQFIDLSMDMAVETVPLIGVSEGELIDTYVLADIKRKTKADLKTIALLKMSDENKDMAKGIQAGHSHYLRVIDHNGSQYVAVKFRSFMRAMPVNVAAKLEVHKINQAKVSKYISKIPGAFQLDREYSDNWLRSCYLIPVQYVLNVELPEGEKQTENKGELCSGQAVE